MIRLFVIAIVAGLLFLRPSIAGEKESAAYEPMAVFANLAGRSWRGEGTGPNGQPIVDIATYEMILGGRAFQSTHRLEDEAYGGRTIFFYDEGEKEYVFHYFTTAGFHTTGVIEPTETGFKAVETISGHPEFAEVHSEILVESNRLRIESFHINHEGEVSPGDALDYLEIENPGALYGDADE